MDQNDFLRNATLARAIRAGFDPYRHSRESPTQIPLPARAFNGRAGTFGKTFSGVIDLQTGRARVDCAEDPTFWMEIDFSQTALWLQPGNPGAEDAVDSARAAAREGETKPLHPAGEE
jgi:hypothetical protein